MYWMIDENILSRDLGAIKPATFPGNTNCTYKYESRKFVFCIPSKHWVTKQINNQILKKSINDCLVLDFFVVSFCYTIFSKYFLCVFTLYLYMFLLTAPVNI